jgi:hypothetical protein
MKRMTIQRETRFGPDTLTLDNESWSMTTGRTCGAMTIEETVTPHGQTHLASWTFVEPEDVDALIVILTELRDEMRADNASGEAGDYHS